MLNVIQFKFRAKPLPGELIYLLFYVFHIFFGTPLMLKFVIGAIRCRHRLT